MNSLGIEVSMNSFPAKINHSRLEGIHSSLEENPFQSLNSIIAWDRADFFSTFALCNAFLNFGPRNISKKSSILKVSKI